MKTTEREVSIQAWAKNHSIHPPEAYPVIGKIATRLMEERHLEQHYEYVDTPFNGKQPRGIYPISICKESNAEYDAKKAAEALKAKKSNKPKIVEFTDDDEDIPETDSEGNLKGSPEFIENARIAGKSKSLINSKYNTEYTENMYRVSYASFQKHEAQNPTLSEEQLMALVIPDVVANGYKPRGGGPPKINSIERYIAGGMKLAGHKRPKKDSSRNPESELSQPNLPNIAKKTKTEKPPSEEYKQGCEWAMQADEIHPDNYDFIRAELKRHGYKARGGMQLKDKSCQVMASQGRKWKGIHRRGPFKKKPKINSPTKTEQMEFSPAMLAPPPVPQKVSEVDLPPHTEPRELTAEAKIEFARNKILDKKGISAADKLKQLKELGLD